MPVITEILAQVWPFILAAAGLLFGYVRHKQAQTQVAQAGKDIAEAKQREAQAAVIVAAANQEAVQAGAKNQEIRRDENVSAAAVPDANSVLHDEWGK